MTSASDEKLQCRECSHRAHILVDHVRAKHDLDAYVATHGGPLWTAYGGSIIRKYHTAVSSGPREREVVALEVLFPDFAARMGHKGIGGTTSRFAEAGEHTPTLDPDYLFPVEPALDAVVILAKPQRNSLYISGPSGTGKTSFVRNLAAKLKAELIMMTADAFLDRGALFGRWVVIDGTMLWQDGLVPMAMKRGAWLCINELDTMNPAAMNLLKPVLEDPATLNMLEDNNTVVRAHPDFRILATANTWARGDSTGQFINTHAQSSADVRRWSAFLLIDYMPAADEERLITRLFGAELEDEEPRLFVKVANTIRDAFKAGRLDLPFSTAEVVNWVENAVICGAGAHHAAKLSFLTRCEPAPQVAIHAMITAVFGRERGSIVPSAP